MSAPLVNWNYDKLKRSSSLIEVSFLSLVLSVRPTESSESTLKTSPMLFLLHASRLESLIPFCRSASRGKW